MAANPSGASTPRKIVRGSQVTFEELFVDAVGGPIIPFDPTQYPSFQIVAPDESVIATGVANSIGDGRWRASWFTPLDAQFASQDRLWRIDWLLVTNNGRQIERSARFEVIDNVEGDATERAYTYLTMLKKTERLIARFFTEQDEISVDITDTAGHLLETHPKGDLTIVHENGTVVYYVDTTPAEFVGCYTIVWNSRQTPVSPIQVSTQQLRVPEPQFWLFQPSLRMYLDKAQKKQGLVQAYSDPDIYDYMVQGVGLVNQYNPMTNWTLGLYPPGTGFEQFIILAAAWWGLNAQYLSEAELAFDFSGQAVTLNVDRTGYYESAMQRIKDHIDNYLPKAKATWLRRQNVGTIASRPYNFSISNSVFRISQAAGTGLSSNFLTIFSSLGLL